MSNRGGRALLLSGVLGLLGGAAACGDDDGGAAGGTTVAEGTGTEEDVAHALAEVDGWEIREHLDPDAGATRNLPGDPGLDWYTGYVREVTTDEVTNSSSVRVSGHSLGMAALAEALPGRRFESASVGAFEAQLGAPPADTEPPVILLALDDTSTLMVLSYGLSLDELVSWTEHLRFVSDEEWAAVPSEP